MKGLLQGHLISEREDLNEGFPAPQPLFPTTGQLKMLKISETSQNPENDILFLLLYFLGHLCVFFPTLFGQRALMASLHDHDFVTSTSVPRVDR